MPQTKKKRDKKQIHEEAGRFITGKPVNFEDLTPEEIEDLFNELQVYQIELDIQNQQILKIQEELSTSRDKFSNLYNFAPVGYITIDKKGIIMDANETATVLLGLERIKLMMKPLTNFIFEDDLNVYYNFREDLLSRSTILNCELRLIKSDGDKFWASLDGQYPHGKNSQEVQFRVVISDISAKKLAEEKIKNINDELENRVKERTKQLSIALENLNHEISVRKKTEEDLRNAKDEISRAFDREKELSELKTRLINMIQHEYKTPLTIILGSTDLIDRLYKSDKKDKIKHYIDTIRTSVDDMTRLLEDTLTLGNAETGKIKYSASYFDMVGLVKQLVAEMSLIDRDEHLILFDSPLDSLKMVSDEKIIRKVLMNLINNAIKFSEPGTEINLELKLRNNEIILKISDRGIGIPESDLEHLFEPFHRGKNTETIPGTGLGLAIVKNCLSVIKGRIAVSNNEKSGATFTISIPNED